ncbi:hypothetical protein [Mycobacterium nebraskense]|uniref:hypothetical protein n=1 Tax=Mycobacterium nebraskense TaxID=244292 RepID=UPI0012E2B25E|nr:hypothetical protein [Mycobacterium nebraskense]
MNSFEAASPDRARAGAEALDSATGGHQLDANNVCSTRSLSAAFAAALAVVTFVGGCSHHSPLGPPTPTGATPLGGPTMESKPPPPPGWKLQPAIPATRQQAQDTVIAYLKKSMQALPPGITPDATRYSGGASVAPCQDVTSGTSPMEFATNGDLTLPPGTGPEGIIAKTGDIWKSWGW